MPSSQDDHEDDDDVVVVSVDSIDRLVLCLPVCLFFSLPFCVTDI